MTNTTTTKPITETEIPLHATRLMQRRIAWWLGAILGVLAVSLASAASGHAELGANPNAYDCSGSIAGGEREAGSEGTPIKYTFTCNGPVTGYQLESAIPLAGLQSAPLVSNEKGQPGAGTFSCGGEVPGFALNCVGSAKAANDKITGQIFIESKLCAEPREEPLLTVTYASVEKTEVVQAISGPFDLGRPQGCRGGTGGTRLSLASSSHKSSKHGKHGKSGKKGKGKKKK